MPEETPARPTEINRVEIGTTTEGKPYGRVVEVPVQPAFGWQNVASGISSGSWAVLLFIGVVAWRYSGTVGKYVEKQMDLLTAMKTTLTNHSDSFTRMAEAEKSQAALLAAMSAADQRLLERVESLNKAVPRKTKEVLVALSELKALHEESHVALDRIDPKYRKPKQFIAPSDDDEEDE